MEDDMAAAGVLIEERQARQSREHMERMRRAAAKARERRRREEEKAHAAYRKWLVQEARLYAVYVASDRTDEKALKAWVAWWRKCPS